MSTCANIAINEGNKLTYIYSHWDGYLDGVGAILFEHYQDEDKIKKLMELGDISSLGENLEAPEVVKKYGFDYYIEDAFKALDPEEQERLSKEGTDWSNTIAYKRDRGEKGVDKRVDTEEKALDKKIYNLMSHSWVEYFYVYDNGKWYYMSFNTEPHLKELEPEIKKIFNK